MLYFVGVSMVYLPEELQTGGSHKKAQKLSQEDVKNKLRTLTQGQKGDKVIESMARTFRVLCDYADWTDVTANKQPDANPIQPNLDVPEETHSNDVRNNSSSHTAQLGLHYNIQIHLPEITNMAVYDAIFQSLKKHLL